MSYPVTALVLNWNNYDDTSDCVTSLQDQNYDALSILVVDNGSTDGSGRQIEEEHPEIDVIFTGENLGFVGGVNRGVKQIKQSTKENHIWLVNNDIVIDDQNLLEDLTYSLDQNGNIGIITPMVMNYPDTETIWFDKGYINWTWFRRGTKNITDPNNSPDFIYNDYVPFCSSLIRSSVIDEVGLLDDRFFLYGEDIDYSIRVRENGYNIATDTRKKVYHKAFSSSGGSFSPIPSYYDSRNRLLYADKYEDKISKKKFYISYMLWIILLLGYRMINLAPSSSIALLKGVKDGLRKNWGKGPYP
ncbi:glycosyltransferase family 2 protein [Natronomonas marina]|uniref:glycosyltransferase family 2 protein n=1 Tax=Natronomonas marina TaxID=2961939 RepID=UPI0020C9CA24|nr:glycosyltransferase family 2 protein [Natronomonas marina]